MSGSEIVSKMKLSEKCILKPCHHNELKPRGTAEAFLHMSVQIKQSQENILELWEIFPERMRPARTYHVRTFGELIVGLTRLKAPGNWGGAADHFIGLEGASNDSCGAVLHHHFGVGIYVDRRCWFCDWNKKYVSRYKLQFLIHHGPMGWGKLWEIPYNRISMQHNCKYSLTIL